MKKILRSFFSAIALCFCISGAPQSVFVDFGLINMSIESTVVYYLEEKGDD